MWKLSSTQSTTKGMGVNYIFGGKQMCSSLSLHMVSTEKLNPTENNAI